MVINTPMLEILDPLQVPAFEVPAKRIYNDADVAEFHLSQAYRDIVTFIHQLNRAMVPRKMAASNGMVGARPRIENWPLQSDAVEFSEPVRRLQALLGRLEELIAANPPDTGPRRFGNASFRRWHAAVADSMSSLLVEYVQPELERMGWRGEALQGAEKELASYFIGGFGSAQRLDYGTGHELSFMAFLGGLWKLNYFAQSTPGVEERGIVLGVVEPYLELIRKLIQTYTLEPAGSHGVWGLDDHSFMPYIFGSAQLAPAISESDPTPTEGSLGKAPDPGDVTRVNRVARERAYNMYFGAIGFIYDVKRGPFWEHSPMLFDISGIRDGWGKINKGMLKMYNAEVLGKFPVVQHFGFGTLFSWARDPLSDAEATAASWASAGTGTRPGPSAEAVPGATMAPWAMRRSENTR